MKSIISRIGAHFNRTIVAGLLAVLAIGITFVVSKFIVDFMGGLFGPLIELISGISGQSIPAPAGFLLSLLVLYILGLASKHALGRAVFHIVHRIILKIPLLKSIHGTAKETVEIFSKNALKNRRIVRTRVFDSDVYAIYTGDTVENGKARANIYCPTTPNITSGFTIIVDKEEMHDVFMEESGEPMGVEEYMKYLLSASVIAPQNTTTDPLKAAEARERVKQEKANKNPTAK